MKMKINMNKIKFFLLLLSSLPSLSFASILESYYPMDKLNTYWNSNFRNAAPDTEWFREIEVRSEKFNPVLPISGAEEAATMGDDLPFEGMIVGERIGGGESGDDGGSSSEKKMNAFPVVPIPSGVAAKLYARLPLLEIFLSRYLKFAPMSTDLPAEVDELTRRYRSVVLELYLINTLRYFAENSFEKKCDRFQRAQELQQGMLQTIGERDLLPEWRPLWSIYENINERIGADILKQVVCNVRPVVTRGEVKKKIQALVDEQIYQEVHKQVEDTIKLLTLAKSEFQAVVNDMNKVEILSNDVMVFVDTLQNVKANLLMVQNDMLKEQTLLGRLNEVDLDKLKESAGGSKELESGINQTKKVFDEIRLGIGELSLLSRSSELPLYRTKLAVCEQMVPRLQSINLSGEDTGTLMRYIMEPYDLCIDEATKMVKDLKKPTPVQKIWSSFANFVNEISIEYLKGP
ncbi:MAG: hypothetical protein HQK52_11970 [Oligoflexia bacterium]|nr:hypothetical protein [Oligoflexia bacterium]